jgi:hypothetical protein
MTTDSSPTDTTYALERPDRACLTCPPPSGKRAWTMADPKFTTCSTCYQRLVDVLVSIRQLWPRLDPSPGSGVGDGRGSPGFGSKPPANLHVITMTDTRTPGDAQMWRGADGRVHAESENPVLSVPGTLYTLAWFLAELRDIAEPPTDVIELTYWLSRHLDWITRRAEVVAFHETLRQLDRQLSLAVDGPPDRPEWLLRCPTCRTPLWRPDDKGVISCRPCGTSWPREQWRELGKQARMARLGLSA